MTNVLNRSSQAQYSLATRMQLRRNVNVTNSLLLSCVCHAVCFFCLFPLAIFAKQAFSDKWAYAWMLGQYQSFVLLQVKCGVNASHAACRTDCTFRSMAHYTLASVPLKGLPFAQAGVHSSVFKTRSFLQSLVTPLLLEIEEWNNRTVISKS